MTLWKQIFPIFLKDNEKEEKCIAKNENFKFSSKPSLENISAELELFVKERNWEQYHTPRNLLLGNYNYYFNFINLIGNG